MSDSPLPQPIPKEITNVRLVTKANLYFDGRVASHTYYLGDGTRKTLGIIYPGEYFFNTDAAERMEIVAGVCRMKLDGHEFWTDYTEGQAFEVPAKAGFYVTVAMGVCEYICTFLP